MLFTSNQQNTNIKKPAKSAGFTEMFSHLAKNELSRLYIDRYLSTG